MAINNKIEGDVPSYVDLPAVLGGTLLALALSIVFAHFGGALGLAINPDTVWEQDTALGHLFAVVLWFLWIQIVASLAGGYFAGRMRQPVAGAPKHEREVRDGAHGLLVWAAGTVLVTIALSIASALAAFVSVEPTIVEEATREPALLAIDQNAAIITAFAISSISLVSGVASWWAAAKGGEHRDQSLDYSKVGLFG